MANSTALVTDAFGKERVGTALGINQIALAAGFVLGPLVGGVLTEANLKAVISTFEAPSCSWRALPQRPSAWTS